jgi:hypothetical protein
MRERGHLDDLDIDERLILKWIFKKWNGSMDWINGVKIGTGGERL